MDILNRLKEATDINKVAGALETSSSDVATPGEDVEVRWNESTPRAEVDSILRATVAELKKAHSRHEDLRVECEQLRKEHGAFRAKVQAWRTSAQQDRESSKKMILSLRAVGEEARDGEYTKALQEQVAQMKESLRSLQGKAETYKLEKDLCDVKWKEKFDQYKDKVDYWRAALTGGRKGDDTTANNTNSDEDSAPPSNPTGQPGPEEFLLLQKDQEIELLKSRANDLEARNKDLQDSVEELRALNVTSAQELQMLMQAHQTELTNRDSNDAQARYVKDLETELKMWREEGRKEGAAAARTPSPLDEAIATVDGDTTTPASPSQDTTALRRKLEEANATIGELRANVDAVRARAESADTDTGAREAALQELYDENMQLRRTMGTHAQQATDAAEMLKQKEKLMEQQKAIHTNFEARIEDSDAAIAKAQRATQTAQKELSKRNETIVRLRNEVSSLKEVTLSRDARRPVEASVGRVGVAGLRGQGQQQDPPVSLAMLLSPEMWTWRKVRVYLAVLFIALFFVFSAYNSRTITQEVDMTDRLQNCLTTTHQQMAMIADLQKQAQQTILDAKEKEPMA